MSELSRDFFTVPIYPCQPRFWASATLVALLGLALSGGAFGQSTFGTVVGTIRDPSGGIIPAAKVQLVNTGTNAIRETRSSINGSYQFVNVDVGTYQLKVETPGFQNPNIEPFELGARETKHLDIDLTVATETTTVRVESASNVQIDVSNVAETKGNLELNDLPVAIYTRAQGSTSAFSTLTAQPGVQTDGGNIIVAGALPSQQSVTVDGISSVGPGAWGPLTELFPSFNAIEEIKISETLNPAEYGGVADITTISRSGTNGFHGGAFENLQNTAFNASDTFSHQVTPVHLNDFGAYVGGPVILPKYNGHNKTFFFASGELLRLPKSQTNLLSVPTQAMRNGDLSAYLDPANGGSTNQLNGYAGNIIPQSQLSPYSQKLLDLFYPLPNYGPPNAVSNNYLATYNIPINSAQTDARVDENINPKHVVYVRYSYKNRRILDLARDDNGNPGSPLLGDTSLPEIYNALTVAYNWIISPSVVNELRGGFSAVHRNVTFGVTSQQAASELGLTSPPLPGPLPSGYDIPTVNIAGFIGIHNPSAYLHPNENTYQVLDTLTWTRGKHTLKFGVDFRYMNALFTQVFTDYQLGNYTFNGSSPANAVLGAGAAVPIAAVLLGYPDFTGIATVTNPNTDSWARNWATFVQDDWKISRSLTLNVGLRWEYHPPFDDRLKNLANFDPNYTSTVNGQTVKGAVIIQDQSNVDTNFAQAIYPTPIITAAQAGVPEVLKFTTHRDFAPRLGFAWRMFGNNKTVLRGGYGRFIEGLLSGAAGDGWAVASSDVGFFTNSLDSNGRPTFSLPYSFPANIAQPGTVFFDLGVQLHDKDPIVEEWDLTLERDLGKGVAVRMSYDGNHSYNLPMREDIDQQQPNTTGYDPTKVPFPLMSDIWITAPVGYVNYNTSTISVRKRSSSFQFEGSYTYTRNLSNASGIYSGVSGFVNENGNFLTNPYNPSLDYGNTPFSRRHRFLATFLYELPFGRGKTFLNATNRLIDRTVGGWVLSGVALFQSGPFMSVTTLSDPSGTGFNLFNGNGGRADTVTGVNPYQGQSIGQWINPNAFADPGNDIGRFGDASAGDVVGPGTKVVSMALLKRILFTESTRLEVGAQVSNVTNHPNYNPPPNLTVGVPGFGALTSMPSAEGAGPRAMQLVARFNF
jgi:hypothetical protein